MKYLILSILACLFLCTACFEKEEIEKEEEVEVVPPEVDILECEIIQKFINYVESEPIREPRPTIKKYTMGNRYVFETNVGGAGYLAITYRDEACDVICGMSSGVGGSNNCSENFLDSLVYMETIWVDAR